MKCFSCEKKEACVVMKDTVSLKSYIHREVNYYYCKKCFEKLLKEKEVKY